MDNVFILLFYKCFCIIFYLYITNIGDKYMNRFGCICLDVSSLGLVLAILTFNFHDNFENAIYCILLIFHCIMIS